MNRFEKAALATATIATLLGVAGSQSFAYRYYTDQLSSGNWPIGVAGWAIATYGPIALAMLFCRSAKRSSGRAPWILHILFLPLTLVIFHIGEALMLSVVNDPDFDATLGGPEFPALLSLIMAIGIYFTAVMAQQTPSSETGPDGR